jgi:hypothetical protein
MHIMETKKKYIKPCIEIISLDNEIALALASSPPAGPSETNLSPEYFKNTPLKDSSLV